MTNINWIALETVEQLDSLLERSVEHPVLIYKHSTRCGVSSMVRSRLERSWKNFPLNIDCYFLDLIAFRTISNQVEELFQVRHESPQTLVIWDKQCIFHASHLGISHHAIQQALDNMGTVTTLG